MIAEESIDRVREAADIVQIIGEHVNLRRTGTDFRGPCPFHQGKHRNFSVSPKKGIYYCFVCHAGGDVFNFLQKHLGVDWPAAVRMVAERTGIELQETTTRRDGPDPREPLWEVNAAAAEWFARVLWDDEAGAPARDYLAGRGITREVADRFGLGWAPRDPAPMRAHLGAQGYDEERQLAAGLLVRREEGGEVVPRFRRRLTFPILDAQGRHVGFGGRLIAEGEPKYLNSAESAVFHKAELLYGLNWAKSSIRRDDRVLVVEGYFDVIRVAAAGVDWVVAPLGTAFTDRQGALLRRLTKNAFLLFDSDRAGLKATFRTGDELLRHGFAVQVVTLPDGEDPDSFVAAHGAERLLRFVGGAIDIFERKVQLLERGGWFADLQRKRRALDRLIPSIRATADTLTRDIYLTRASEASGVSKELLQREVDDVVRATPAPSERASGAPSRAPYRRPDDLARGRTSDRRRADRRQRAEAEEAAERELLLVMVSDRAQVEALAERVDASDFRNAAYREVFQALLEVGADAADTDLLEALGPEASAAAADLFEHRGAVVDPRRTVADSLTWMARRRIIARQAELDELLPTVADPEKDEIIREKQRLRDQLRELGGHGKHYGKSRS